jgi:hypothetical protein
MTSFNCKIFAGVLHEGLNVRWMVGGPVDTGDPGWGTGWGTDPFGRRSTGNGSARDAAGLAAAGQCLREDI